MADEKDLVPKESRGDIVIYQTEDGGTKIDVRFEGETVWLTQQQMAELFQTSRTNIVEHIGHIYEEGELDEASTCRKFRQVRDEGSRRVTREIPHYNLDMIISLGYRVKSRIATHFRRWATERLKEYMLKGFTMDDERLKELGGGNYWKELLARIRDIRSSEKVMYRQVLDLYATSVDYDPNSAESVAFFKMVQNKLHYAAHGHTAAEVIYERADADKPFMGLTAFSGDFPTAKDIGIAKNYLTEEELRAERHCFRIFRLCRGAGNASPPHAYERLCGAFRTYAFRHGGTGARRRRHGEPQTGYGKGKPRVSAIFGAKSFPCGGGISANNQSG